MEQVAVFVPVKRMSGQDKTGLDRDSSLLQSTSSKMGLNLHVCSICLCTCTCPCSIVLSPSVLTELKFHIAPSTADDKERQYVYLDLCASLPPSYPQTTPTLSILQSRGLADAHLRGSELSHSDSPVTHPMC